MTAILIGDRSGLSPEDERRLQEAGTYHVIAISGGNIALLTAMLVALGRVGASAAAADGRRRRSRCSAFYGYAAGLAPSVLRATVAGMIYLAARAADHRGAALNALGVAAARGVRRRRRSACSIPASSSRSARPFAIVVAVRRLAPAPPASRASGRCDGVARLAQAIRTAAHGARRRHAVRRDRAGASRRAAVRPRQPRRAGPEFRRDPADVDHPGRRAGRGALVRVASPIGGGAAGWIAHAGTVGLLRSAALVDVAPWLVHRRRRRRRGG